MDKKIMDTVIPAAALGLGTFLLSLLFSYFFGFNSIISVGTSTVIENNKYIVPIDIETYGNLLKDVEIVIDSQITKNQIKASQPVDIKISNDSISTSNTTKLEIKQISKGQVINLFIITDKKLLKDEINIYANGGKVDILYDSITVDPLKNQIKRALLVATIYAVFQGISAYYLNKKSDDRLANYKRDRDQSFEVMTEKVKSADENSEQLKIEIERTQAQIDEVKNELTKTRNNSMKRQILLRARLNDYSKELGFWRNTIRKILYNESNKGVDVEKLFEIVSNSLKTYQTKEKSEFSFEELKVLSKLIKDIDEENK
nr:hypothetical protein [Lysinibacillus sphaericus]